MTRRRITRSTLRIESQQRWGCARVAMLHPLPNKASPRPALAAALCIAPLWSSHAGTAAEPQWLARRYDPAVALFRQARFAAAFGRFIELAAVGHPPSARYALWMCETGLVHFGRPSDCAPDEVEDWARLGGHDPQDAVRRVYPASAAPSTASSGCSSPAR